MQDKESERRDGTTEARPRMMDSAKMSLTAMGDEERNRFGERGVGLEYGSFCSSQSRLEPKPQQAVNSVIEHTEEVRLLSRRQSPYL